MKIFWRVFFQDCIFVEMDVAPRILAGIQWNMMKKLDLF